jgi:hypothetical protein
MLAIGLVGDRADDGGAGEHPADEAFEGFHVYALGIALPEGIGVTAGSSAIKPVLRPEVAAILLAQSWPDALPTRGPRWRGWTPRTNPPLPRALAS